jgi:hypothetical protein
MGQAQYVGYFDVREKFNRDLWQMKYGKDDDLPRWYHKWPMEGGFATRGSWPWVH